VNKGDTVLNNIHWDGYGDEHKHEGHDSYFPGLSEGYHRIGLEWTPEEYIFYVNDVEMWRTDQAVSHRPEYIILSLEVGKWAGNIQQADLPDTLFVDYVRVYEHKPDRK
jgi:beta-glucanase (GH16 family)